ncbi:hypothetical protein D3C76_993920 [compost metagenome]
MNVPSNSATANWLADNHEAAVKRIILYDCGKRRIKRSRKSLTIVPNSRQTWDSNWPADFKLKRSLMRTRLPTPG